MAEYIERRALFNRLADYWNIPRDWDGGIAQPCEDALTIIEDFPAADVEPVRHGRWIKTVQENGCAEWTEFECCVCGAVFDGNERLFDEWKGCPVCLTRMDLEE